MVITGTPLKIKNSTEEINHLKNNTKREREKSWPMLQIVKLSHVYDWSMNSHSYGVQKQPLDLEVKKKAQKQF